MANPDDPEFDSFVEGIMDTSFSSAFYPNEPEDFDMDDVILHNITNSDTDSESGVPNEGLPSTSGGNQNNDGLPGRALLKILWQRRQVYGERRDDGARQLGPFTSG
ncbi:hypothetical protein J6590_057717 [Homalodisca vitripennis]|nr:hypothetical protein J6590_057717 [Homalodisca vitripennis]